MSILSTTKTGISNYIIIHGANHFIEKTTAQICDKSKDVTGREVSVYDMGRIH